VSYDVGDLVTLTTVAQDSAGTPVNTPTLTLAVTKPDGTAVSPAPTVTNTGIDGVYTAQVTPDAAGIWTYTWTATGTVTGKEFGQFEVRGPRQLVASIEELKGHLRFSSTIDDGRLLDCLTAVTDIMEGVVGPVTPTEFTERHNVRGCAITPRRHPLVSVTSITPWQRAALVADTDYVLMPDVNLIQLATYHSGLLHTVVYEAGHDPWPTRLKLAGLIIAQHEWSVRNGTGGRPSPDADSLAMIPGSGYLVPHRALELMRNSLRPMAA
jgi:hypothetical protein